MTGSTGATCIRLWLSGGGSEQFDMEGGVGALHSHHFICSSSGLSYVAFFLFPVVSSIGLSTPTPRF